MHIILSLSTISFLLAVHEVASRPIGLGHRQRRGNQPIIPSGDVGFVQLAESNYCWSQNGGLTVAVCNPSDLDQLFRVTKTKLGIIISDAPVRKCVGVLKSSMHDNSLGFVDCDEGSPAQTVVFSSKSTNPTLLQSVSDPQLCINQHDKILKAGVCPKDNTDQSKFQFRLINNPVAVSNCTSAMDAVVTTTFIGNGRIGSLYGTPNFNPLIDVYGNSAFTPQPIHISVVDGSGAPLSWCPISWNPRNGSSSGWAFPQSLVTDATGSASAYWVSGYDLLQYLDILLGGENGSTTVSGVGFPLKTTATTVNLTWNIPAWKKFSVDVVPHSLPPFTYYEAIGLEKSSAGIRNGLIAWTVQDKNPSVVVSNPNTTCIIASSDDVGLRCAFNQVVNINQTYTFEMESLIGSSKRQNTTLRVRDHVTGRTFDIATVETDAHSTPSTTRASIRDTSMIPEFSCLSTDQRYASFSKVKYIGLDDDKWIEVPKTKAAGTASFNPGSNQVCWNYGFDFSGEGQYWFSTGGSFVGTRPLNLPGGATLFVT
ncbi:hypothetical protein BCR33DRAFT_787184 [Rhizoclosmatium globosum]|uniref:Uncharacterized protein n=1 Tax=Rhizoclosmatium globosum TaxID=329046 RepID=A0A1Y2C1P2_9FUNG|nr:hypothetical protein BCR33DRAFT_787184 [Rhizoclosmatium globosum]|eukprot:ORY40952.1 hypothetical protein BCR33DRAFT_787184 [Rhizoclosmatium globosum]